MFFRIFISCILITTFLVSGNESVSKSEFPKPFLENLEGWSVEWNPIFKKQENKKKFVDIRKALANHLQRITYILEAEKVEALRKLFIRVDLDHKLTNMQYHPSKGWLIQNKHDPSLEKEFMCQEQCNY